jgi:hypothetical protein
MTIDVISGMLHLRRARATLVAGDSTIASNGRTRSFYPAEHPFVDAIISDILVVLDPAYEARLADALTMLKSAGMEIRSADDDNSVVEGTIEEALVHGLEKLECVDYVRKVFTYYANFPPGDPRDRDGV